MNNNIAIKVENLSKVYKLYNSPMDRLKESLHPLRRKYHHDFYALNDISFEIIKGETIGIIGKNGSGKSTLLKIIAGVLTPSLGNIEVKGRISALLELGSGFNPELTGIENVYFNGMLMGFTREEMNEKLDDILAFADIGEFVYQPVKTYSSGMFVRLAFAVAINVDPQILIVDEALSVGDALFSTKCLIAIERFRQKGASILYVTHDTGSITSLCERAIYLKEGRINAIGKAGVIADQYLRALREESGLAVNVKSPKIVPKISNTIDETFKVVEPKPETIFKNSVEFAKKVDYFRYGTGEAKCVNAEVLDEDGNLLSHAKFDQVIRIRLYVECYNEAVFTVNYNIRDSKNNYIIGSNFRIENVDLIEGKSGDKYIVDYETRVPLSAGNYSLLTEITNPVILNKCADIIDIIDNATEFIVVERSNAIIWAKVYIENKVSIHKM